MLSPILWSFEAYLRFFMLFDGAINRSGSSLSLSLSLSFGPLLLDLIKPPFIQIQTADVEEVASHE